ncbi:MAG: PAS domain S-box protein [Candidatus Syntrophonatronum acetioxidans]|uniref:Stage 0 sporulation protein A homolog n=1 Tax=Candidatus Syntrophonatronum acetioxidans TaxID=1795816 RepID=A0A424YGA8_9FIRM|nr:MAG: PAS domain S-box protein [Candidatus Syntrophonatronum acetioxidans]
MNISFIRFTSCERGFYKLDQRKPSMANWALDLKTGVITGSQEMFCTWGLTESGPEITYGQFLNMIHPDDRKAFEDTIENIMVKLNRKSTINYRIMRSEGGMRLLHSKVEAALDEKNEPYGIFGIVQDITEQLQEKRAAKAQGQAEFERGRLESILEAVPPAIVIIEANSKKFSYMNQRAMELYGCNYIGMDLEKHIANVNARKPDGTFYPLEEMPVSKSLKFGEKVRNQEMFIEGIDGVSLPVLVSSTPLFDEDGKITAAIGVFEDITQYKGMECALKDSEERFRVLIDTVAQALWETDAHGVVCTDSPTWRAYTGQTYEEWLGYGWVKAVHPDDWEHAERKWREAVAAERNIDAEFRLKSPDGTWRWSNVLGAPVRDLEGKIKKWVGMNIDIHQRKLAEAALRESELRLSKELEVAKLLQDLSTQLVQAENVEVLYDQLLATMIKILGSDFATIQQFYPERGQEGELYLLKHQGFDELDTGYWKWINPHSSKSSCGLALKTRRRVVFTDVLNCDYMAGSPGLKQYLQAGVRAVQSTPLLSPTGDLLGMISTHWREPHQLTEREIRSLDVMARLASDLIERNLVEENLHKAYYNLERKVAERTAELVRANERLQQEIKERIEKERALRQSEEKYRLMADNNPDLIVNFDRQLKFTFVNRSMCRMFGLERHEFIGKTLYDLFPQEQARKWEYLFKEVLAGSSVEDEATIISLPDGTVRSFWFTLVPIIDEKGKITGIMETCRDITEQKKMQTEILKGDKLESLGVLAGGIAHDFNNYLAILLGNISMLKRYKNDPQKVLEKVEGMEKATMRAKDLSNQLFTFAKGGALVKERVLISQLIFDDVKFALSGSNTRGTFIIPEDLYMVEVDRGQISQVLNNIVINALQAMPEGGVLELHAENVILDEGDLQSLPLKKGPYVKITVKDEGIGIPEKNLSKIFDPFFTTKVKGKGLGLATAYSIIKNHDGLLTIESEEGVGTTLIIYLPALVQAPSDLKTREDVLEGKGRILVMEDEEDLLAATGEMLSSLGYDVSYAREGREAVQLYSYSLNNEHPFDLVILDLTISGGLGGEKTIRELLKKDPGIKAVVTSGYSNDPVMANYRDYGFKGRIKKPFNLEELSRLVYEIIVP